ncbi:hypothetical protein HDU99_009903 [Rhizoclosmatium hyalinum]|nr:hypothetical protein HDU99_009903 [Rhizoclosmatium hyalinum]
MKGRTVIPRGPAELAQGLFLELGTGGGCIDPTYQPVREKILWESDAKVHERFAKVVEELLEKLEGDLVICTHAVGVICGVRGLLGDAHANVLAGVSTYCKLVQNEEGRWTLVENGARSHLPPDSELYYWTFKGAFAPRV